MAIRHTRHCWAMTSESFLLSHECKGITKDELILPGPDFIDRVFLIGPSGAGTAEPGHRVYSHGRLGGTGYLSILPVDQGIEHSAAASFAKNPAYFDPARLCDLAIGGDCSADRHHPWGPRHRGAAVRAQDPLHREAEPQRLPSLSEYLRPGDVRIGAPGLRPGRGRVSEPPSTSAARGRQADRRGLERIRRGPPTRPLHGALVLPAEPGLQDHEEDHHDVPPT